MTSEAFETATLRHLASIDAQLGHGNARMAEIEYALKDTASAVRLQNGRVGKLEDKEWARELREATETGRDLERAQTVLSRGQLALIVAVSSAIPAVVGAFVAFREVAG